MKTLVSILALSLIVAFSAPAFAGTPKTQAACEKAGHALGYGCQEMLQGYVDSTPRGLKGQRRFAQGGRCFLKVAAGKTPSTSGSAEHLHHGLLGENGSIQVMERRPKPTPEATALSCATTDLNGRGGGAGV